MDRGEQNINSSFKYLLILLSRNCIGNNFAFLQIKIAIIQLLLNFKFETSEKTPKSLNFDPNHPVLSLREGVWLKMKRI